MPSTAVSHVGALVALFGRLLASGLQRSWCYKTGELEDRYAKTGRHGRVTFRYSSTEGVVRRPRRLLPLKRRGADCEAGSYTVCISQHFPNALAHHPCIQHRRSGLTVQLWNREATVYVMSE